MSINEFLEAKKVTEEERQILLGKLAGPSGGDVIKAEAEMSKSQRKVLTNELTILRAQNVKVVSISIPFGDMMRLTFQSICAALIIVGIPAFFFVLIAFG